MKADMLANRSAESSSTPHDGKKPANRLRFLDVSFDGKDLVFKNDGLDNGRFPHGGYKGSRRHPLGLYSFDKGKEVHKQMREDLDFELVRDTLAVPSPAWAMAVHRWRSHSGESPLLSCGFLAASKLEGKNGSTASAGGGNTSRTPSDSSRHPSSAGAGSHQSGGVVYYRPTRPHPYLTATELRDCAECDCEDLVRYGRPTRTTLLRARQKLSSSTNGHDSRRHSDHKPEDPKLCCFFSDPKELLQLESEMDGETYHSFLTGARYNRANCLDSHSMEHHGLYMSRQNPLGCFIMPNKLEALHAASAPSDNSKEREPVLVIHLPPPPPPPIPSSPSPTSPSPQHRKQRPGTTQSDSATLQRRPDPPGTSSKPRSKRRAHTRSAVVFVEPRKKGPLRKSTTTAAAGKRLPRKGAVTSALSTTSSSGVTSRSRGGDDYVIQGSPTADAEEGGLNQQHLRPTTAPGQGKKPLGPILPHPPPSTHAVSESDVTSNDVMELRIVGQEADIRAWSPGLKIRGHRAPINTSREGPFKFECKLPRLRQTREVSTEESPLPGKQPPPPSPVTPAYVRLDNSFLLPALGPELEVKPLTAHALSRTSLPPPPPPEKQKALDEEEKEEEKTGGERDEQKEEEKEECVKEESMKEETKEEEKEEEEEEETATGPDGEKDEEETKKVEEDSQEKTDTDTPPDVTGTQQHDVTPPAAEEDIDQSQPTPAEEEEEQQQQQQQQSHPEEREIQNQEANQQPQEDKPRPSTAPTQKPKEKPGDDVMFFVTEGAVGVDDDDDDADGDVTKEKLTTEGEAARRDELQLTEREEDAKESSRAGGDLDTDAEGQGEGEGQVEPLKVVVTHKDRGSNEEAKRSPPSSSVGKKEEEEEEVIAKHP